MILIIYIFIGNCSVLNKDHQYSFVLEMIVYSHLGKRQERDSVLSLDTLSLRAWASLYPETVSTTLGGEGV